jgi:myo-inositol-1-phosphate synthase
MGDSQQMSSKLIVVKTKDVLTDRQILKLYFGTDVMSQFEIINRKVDIDILELLFHAYEDGIDIHFVNRRLPDAPQSNIFK